MFCIQCGKEIPDGSTGCPHCGAATRPASTMPSALPNQTTATPQKQTTPSSEGAAGSYLSYTPQVSLPTPNTAAKGAQPETTTFKPAPQRAAALDAKNNLPPDTKKQVNTTETAVSAGKAADSYLSYTPGGNTAMLPKSQPAKTLTENIYAHTQTTGNSAAAQQQPSFQPPVVDNTQPGRLPIPPGNVPPTTSVKAPSPVPPPSSGVQPVPPPSTATFSAMPPAATTTQAGTPTYSAATYPAGTQPHMPGQPPVAGNATKPKKKKTALFIAIAAIVVLLVAAAILVPYFIEQNRASRYEAAQNLMDSGEFAAAEEAFLELGSYQEAEQLAAECRNEIQYADALELMDTGDYQAAADAFENLGDFEDSSALAQECLDTIEYDKAVKLMDAGDYEGAHDIFSQLGNFKDSYQKTEDCKANIEYAKADAAFNEGKYYDAYTIFIGLGDFDDAAQRAESCIQGNPGTAIVYHNENYTGNVIIEFHTSEGETENLFIKIYAEDGTHAASVFVKPGETLQIKVPAGNYKFHTAYGTNWFGDQDMFGEEGIYTLSEFDNKGEAIALVPIQTGTRLTFITSTMALLGADKLERIDF